MKFHASYVIDVEIIQYITNKNFDLIHVQFQGVKAQSKEPPK
jgi:hypothetical protein